MINLVLKNRDDQMFFKQHRPDLNFGCGGNEVTDDPDQAAVFQAEFKDGKLEIVNGTVPTKGEWEARAVKFLLK